MVNTAHTLCTELSYPDTASNLATFSLTLVRRCEAEVDVTGARLSWVAEEAGECRLPKRSVLGVC